MLGEVNIVSVDENRSYRIIDMEIIPNVDGDVNTDLMFDSRFTGRVIQLELWPDAIDTPPDDYDLNLTNAQLLANAINVIKEGSIGAITLTPSDVLFLCNPIHAYFMTGSYKLTGTFSNMAGDVKVHLKLILEVV